LIREFGKNISGVNEESGRKEELLAFAVEVGPLAGLNEAGPVEWMFSASSAVVQFMPAAWNTLAIRI
jgi:hypothetical protein